MSQEFNHPLGVNRLIPILFGIRGVDIEHQTVYILSALKTRQLTAKGRTKASLPRETRERLGMALATHDKAK